MKKVLYIAHLQSHIRNFHLDYLKHLKDRGFVVEVATCVDNFKQLSFLDKVYDVPFRRSPFNYATIKNYKLIKKILIEGNYDIVHCHTPVASIIARLAAHNGGIKSKVYYTAHGFHFYKGASLVNWLIYYPAEYLCSKYTDVLFTINIEDYQLAMRKFKHPKVVFVNGIGVDVDFGCVDYSRAKDTIDLFSAGELNKNKNHILVLKALAKLQDPSIHYYIAGEGELRNQLSQFAKNNGLKDNFHLLGFVLVLKALAKLQDPSIHYYIAGEGELRNQLSQFAKNNGLKDNFHLLGFVNNIHETYLKMDVFVFPSKREGLSVSLMDAMSAGMPCIVTKIRGNVDLIDEKGGIFVENDVDGVVKAIQCMIVQKDQWSMMGLHNHNKVKNYSKEIVFNQMDEFYGESK